MAKLIAAVRRRVNPGGVKEVIIRPYGAEQIEIVIPEVDSEEAKRIEKLVSRAGTLEFRILASAYKREHTSLIERARNSTADNLFDPADPERLEAWWVPIQTGEEDSFSKYSEIATRQKQRGEDTITEVLVVSDGYNVKGGYLERATADFDNKGQPCVTFMFNSKGGRYFGGLTGDNLPDPVQKERTSKLGIILDGYLYSAPSIQSTIYDRGEITGSFTRQEVDDLVNVLNAARPRRSGPDHRYGGRRQRADLRADPGRNRSGGRAANGDP